MKLSLQDSRAQAHEGWRIGLDLCDCPGSYHSLWGVLRQAKAIGGARLDMDSLAPVLNDLVKPNGSILIAGAADAGLLELCASAIDARPLDIAIVDMCPAPLRLIEAIAPPPGIEVETRQANLLDLADRNRHNLILCHSVLSYVGDEARIAMLRRLRAALKSEGRLVLTWRVSTLAPEDLTDEINMAWRADATARIAEQPDLVALCGDELDQRLGAWASTRPLRAAPFTAVGRIDEMLAAGGFVVERHIVGEQRKRPAPDGKDFTKQSHIFVARPI